MSFSDLYPYVLIALNTTMLKVMKMMFVITFVITFYRYEMFSTDDATDIKDPVTQQDLFSCFKCSTAALFIYSFSNAAAQTENKRRYIYLG